MPSAASRADAPERAGAVLKVPPARPRRRAVWIVATSVFIALVMAGAAWAAAAEPQNSATPALSPVAAAPVESGAVDQLLAAENSLGAGQGPGGVPLACAANVTGLSATCTAPPSGRPAVSTSTMAWESSITPNARAQASIIYDAKDGYVLLFGGWNGTAIYGDTWTFVHGNWIALDLSIAPSPRWDSAITYDKKDGYVVLFGGRNATSVLGDTWSFAAGAWTLRSVSPTPSPRFGAALVYDSHDGYVVLFGGSNGSSSQADTWKYVGGGWSLLYPAPGALPLAGPTNAALSGGSGAPHSGPLTPTYPIGRVDAAITFDNKDNYVVLFGGLNQTPNGSDELNDTWEFSSGKWMFLAESFHPGPRSQAVFTWDSSDVFAFLFAGTNLTSQLDDAWTFVNGTWHNVTYSSQASARAGAAGVWDVADLEILIFSGDEQGFPATIPDTWQIVHGAWNVTKSTPDLTWPAPAARIGASEVYDYYDQYAVYFGGITAYGTNNETWKYVNLKWHQEFLTVAPSPRSYSGIAYDPVYHYVVLFGGRAPNGSALNDTWVWHNFEWFRLNETVSPTARYGAGMSWDNADSEVLLFGGIGAGGQALSDTWKFIGGNWTNVTATSGEVPPARAYAVFANDSRDNVVVMFGGENATAVLSDTWTYAHGTWSTIGVLGAHPSTRWGAQAVFDTNNNYFLLFGGCGQAVSPLALACNHLDNDTWRFVAGKWVAFTPANSVIPFARVGANMIYDGKYDDKYVVMFGGLVNRSTGLLTIERWAFGGTYQLWGPTYYPSPRMGAAGVFEFRDLTILMFGGYGPLPGGGVGFLGDTWEQDTYRWTQAEPTRSPSARAWSAIGWDGTDDYSVLFGGENQSGYLGDTWWWDGGYVTGAWHPLTPKVSPSARANDSLAWDPTDGYTVLFGGQNASGALGDTWEFVKGVWTQLTPAVSPAPRAGANLVWDYGDGYMILFGGWNPVTQVAYNDTWKFLGGQWTLLTSASGFAPRHGAAAMSVCAVSTTSVTCPAADYVVGLFGGATSSGAFLGDTWTFSAGAWTQHVYKPGQSPLPSAYGFVADDHDDGNIELFSGYNGGYLDSFWSFANPPF